MQLTVLLPERQSLHSLEQILRRHAHMSELGLVNPVHDGVFVHKNTGRKGYVGTAHTLSVPNIQLVEEDSFLIGQKGEAGAETLPETLQNLGWIDAYGDNADTSVLDPLLEFLELPELTRAERSPATTVEQIERCGLTLEALAAKGLAGRIGQSEARQSLSGQNGHSASPESSTDPKVHKRDSERDELDEKQRPLQKRRPLHHRKRSQ